MNLDLLPLSLNLQPWSIVGCSVSSLLPYCCDKAPRRRQLTKESFHWAYAASVGIHDGRAQVWCHEQLRAHIFWSRRQRTGLHWECSDFSFETLVCSEWHTSSKVVTYPNFSHTVPTIRDQVFKHMNLWRTFSGKSSKLKT